MAFSIVAQKIGKPGKTCFCMVLVGLDRIPRLLFLYENELNSFAKGGGGNGVGEEAPTEFGHSIGCLYECFHVV